MKRGDSFCQRVTEKEQERSSCLIHQIHLLPFHTSLTVPPVCSTGWSPPVSAGSPLPPTWTHGIYHYPPASAQGLQNVTQLECEALKTDEKEKPR